MVYVIHEYRSRAGASADFENLYATPGPWQELLAKQAGHVHTDLLRSETEPNVYIVLSFWMELARYQAFSSSEGATYMSLRESERQISESARFLGVFRVLPRRDL